MLLYQRDSNAKKPQIYRFPATMLRMTFCKSAAFYLTCNLNTQISIRNAKLQYSQSSLLQR